jgi:hypothetical protein
MQRPSRMRRREGTNHPFDALNACSGQAFDALNACLYRACRDAQGRPFTFHLSTRRYPLARQAAPGAACLVNETNS